MDDTTVDPFGALAVTAVSAAIAAVAIAVVLVIVAFAIYRAAGSRMPHVPLVVALSMMSMLALVGYLIIPERDEAGALAGVGLGALAGALTTIYTARASRTARGEVGDVEPEDEASDS